MSRSVDPIEENPFEAPASGRDIEAPTDLYKVSIRKLSTENLRALAPNRLSFAVFWLVKTLRLEFATVAANARGAKLIEVPYESLPEANRESIREAEEACRDAGLVRQCAYRFPFVAPGPPDVGVIYATPDGRILANLHSQWQRGANFVTTAKGSFGVSSRKRNGGWLTSLNTRGMILGPWDGTEQRVTPERSIPELLVDHHKWAEERSDEIEPITADRIFEAQSGRQQAFIEDLIERGILVPLNRKELRTLVRRVESAPKDAPRRPRLSARLRVAAGWAGLAFVVLGFGTLVLIPNDPSGRLSEITLIGMTVALVTWLCLIIVRWVVDRSGHSQSR